MLLEKVTKFFPDLIFPRLSFPPTLFSPIRYPSMRFGIRKLNTETNFQNILAKYTRQFEKLTKREREIIRKIRNGNDYKGGRNKCSQKKQMPQLREFITSPRSDQIKAITKKIKIIYLYYNKINILNK